MEMAPGSSCLQNLTNFRNCLKIFLLIIFCQYLTAYISESKPNIIFILTDDQDSVLGGMTPMSKTRKLIGDAGITFNNMFTTSPLCCPSRSSIFTGDYIHNHNAINNSLSGNCSSQAWQDGPEKRTFATYLKSAGYVTFFAGKYLNQYGDKRVGGIKHVPPGWDWWTALKYNSVYYNYELSINGTSEKHGSNYSTDYLTDYLANRSQEFLKFQHQDSQKPFFMMVSTPACHAPVTPAPQYSKNFATKMAPRDSSFNTHASDKHWVVRHAPHPMTNVTIEGCDEDFRNRWRTLLSVDDLVEGIITTLEAKKLLQNTYVFFSSDNGYHLGQFSLPRDKRHLYEFDIRVPLLVRGPGIKAGQTSNEIALNIDLMPTFLDLAGFSVLPNVDGLSLKVILHSNGSKINWRTDFLVEYFGEYLPAGKKDCPNSVNLSACFIFADKTCVCDDAINNTYVCARMIEGKTDVIYCEFSDKENYIEFYDLQKDPHQISNIVKAIDPEFIEKLNKRLLLLSICQGASCRTIIPPEQVASANDLLIH